MFGLDPKSVAVGGLIGLFILPRILAPVMSKLGGSKAASN